MNDESDFASQYDELYDTLTKTRQNEIWGQYLESLRKNADITDNRLRML